MEYQWISLLPPILAIGLALVTKKVILSLLLGSFAGALILQSGNPISAVTQIVGTIYESVTDGWNLSILLFLVFLGILVQLITAAGGTQSYGQWAAKKIKSREGALLSTFFLGVAIFIDDYFNALTVGTVMQPITDKYNISRAKLAYVIDATAAPICIIAPVSSWVVTVMSTMGDKFRAEGIAVDPFIAFIQVIPYNLYALLTLIAVVVIARSSWDFGKMAAFEKHALATGEVHGPEGKQVADVVAPQADSKGNIWDLVLPIAFLLVAVVVGMLYTGGYFAGGTSLFNAIGDTDAAEALKLGGFWALVFTILLMLPRKVVDVGSLPTLGWKGLLSMWPAITILIAAWTIGGIVGQLGTGVFLANQVGASLPSFIYPAILFVLAGFVAFSTGTSWGTFAIMIPIAIDFALALSPEAMLMMVAAVLAGAVFGDHASPISDTTILSSTGAGCTHIDHVSTQLPYALLVAGVSFVGYLISGILVNLFGHSFIVSLISLAIAVVLLIASLRVTQGKAGVDLAAEKG